MNCSFVCFLLCGLNTTLNFMGHQSSLVLHPDITLVELWKSWQQNSTKANLRHQRRKLKQEKVKEKIKERKLVPSGV